MESKLDIRLSEDDLRPQEALDFVNHPAAGGIALFVGTVRDNTRGRSVQRLEFEAYAPMAVSEMEKIARQVRKRWQAEGVAIHHRVGTLAIGGIAVVIAVATPHRGAAFAACQYAIDTLKETVPIWKKEVFEDGAVWVAAHP